MRNLIMCIVFVGIDSELHKSHLKRGQTELSNVRPFEIYGIDLNF